MRMYTTVVTNNKWKYNKSNLKLHQTKYDNGNALITNDEDNDFH